MLPEDFKKIVEDKVGDALSGCFMDATVFGTGFIKVTILNGDLDIVHIPFEDLEKTLEAVVQFKNLVSNKN